MRQTIPKLIVSFSICFFIALSVHSERLPIKIYTSADGLGSSFISYIMRDSRGFLWICTRDGLTRFDGAHFVTYQVGDKNAPPGIERILETRKGIYWITTTNGLYRFDPDASLAVAETKSGDRPILNAEFISESRGTLYEDRNGNLWSQGDGLYSLEEHGHQLTFQKVELNLPFSKAGAFGVAAICEGQDGSFWLATSWGLLIRRLPDGRQVIYEVGAPEINGLLSILEDRNGRIWCAGAEGVIVIKPESLASLASMTVAPVHHSNEVRAVRTASIDHVSLPEKPGEIVKYPDLEGKDKSHARFLSQTADGHIWIGNGLDAIEFDEHLFHTYTVAQGFLEGIERIVEDGSGNLWLSGINGLMRLARGGLTSYKTTDGLGDQNIQSIGHTRDGNLFTLGGNLSLSFFDGHSFESIRPAWPTGSQVLWTSNPVLQDSRGEWWFLTNGKLYRFAATSDFHSLAHAQPRAAYDMGAGLKGNAMFHVFEDSHVDLWFSTHDAEGSRRGLTKWSPVTEKFYAFSEAEGFPPDKAPSALAEDRSGNLWVGFYEGGMVRYRNGVFTEFTAADAVPNGLITALYSDRQGRLWIGSALDGLAHVDDPTAAHPRFVKLTLADGLASNNVRSITEDLFGNLYVGTARGVDRLAANTARIKHYSTNDGLAGDFVSSAFRDESGAVWFGTPSGISRLVPAPDKTLAAPSVWVSGLRIAGESRPVPTLGSAAISNLELAPAQNNLQIDFLAIDFNAGQDLRYQYMLEGADKDWGAPTQLRTVNYANLASGSYRFIVRAINANGLASSGSAVVSFRVLAPFWRRWWFLTLAAICIGAVVFSVDRYRVARVREREQAETALRRAREERLVELERVRKRIASDLHDDIGSSLTQISLLSEVVSQRIDRDNASVTQPLAMIANSSRELVDAMSDIVWAINPHKDHLSDLTQRMRSLASEVFTVCGIKFHFRTPAVDIDLPLGANLRREVFLIFKESVNNTIKHSGATEVDIEFSVDRDHLFLRVADNGKGFDSTQESDGHGLISMRARGEDIGGKLEIRSDPGKGMTVTLRVPLRDHGVKWFNES